MEQICLQQPAKPIPPIARLVPTVTLRFRNSRLLFSTFIGSYLTNKNVPFINLLLLFNEKFILIFINKNLFGRPEMIAYQPLIYKPDRFGRDIFSPKEHFNLDCLDINEYNYFKQGKLIYQ
jgi:hypothetical protein